MNEKCQVFTPDDYVEELLNSVGYVQDIFEKKILENSCGDGKILMTIVDRYIHDCKVHGLKDFDGKRKFRYLLTDIMGLARSI